MLVDIVAKPHHYSGDVAQIKVSLSNQAVEFKYHRPLLGISV